MSPPSEHQQFPMAPDSDPAVTISSQLMIAAVFFLFIVVVFIFFLYLYAKHYMGSNPSLRRSRAQFIIASDEIPVHHHGLDVEILKSLPVTIYKPSEFKGGLECSVCLSELSEGEEARLLPKCNHGFHVECIDMWFQSHSTCPLCRAPVTMLDSVPLENQPSGEGILSNFPTNVLFWGNQDAVSNGVASQERTTSSSLSLKKPEGMLVIDIPRRGMEDIISPLPMSRFPNDEMKSPMEEVKTPKSARLRSFRRLLSRGKMVIGSSCSPRGGDIEQGEGSSITPGTPISK